MGRGISPKPQARANNAFALDCAATAASASPPRRRKESTARGDSTPESLRSVLSREFSQILPRFLHVVQGELAGFNQVRHHRLGPSAEQRQQLVNQPALCLV